MLAFMCVPISFFIKRKHSHRRQGGYRRITWMNLREVGSENKRWIELAQGYVESWPSLLVLLNLWVMLLQC
jgi:hypothetical protein